MEIKTSLAKLLDESAARSPDYDSSQAAVSPLSGTQGPKKISLTRFVKATKRNKPRLASLHFGPQRSSECVTSDERKAYSNSTCADNTPVPRSRRKNPDRVAPAGLPLGMNRSFDQSGRVPDRGMNRSVLGNVSQDLKREVELMKRIDDLEDTVLSLRMSVKSLQTENARLTSFLRRSRMINQNVIKALYENGVMDERHSIFAAFKEVCITIHHGDRQKNAKS